MSFREVIQLFERRRAELVDILKNRKDTIDLSRQHQIYGAIKEIELFLETLNYYHESMIRDLDKVDNIIMGVDEKPLISRMKDAFSGLR